MKIRALPTRERNQPLNGPPEWATWRANGATVSPQLVSIVGVGVGVEVDVVFSQRAVVALAEMVEFGHLTDVELACRVGATVVFGQRTLAVRLANKVGVTVEFGQRMLVRLAIRVGVTVLFGQRTLVKLATAVELGKLPLGINVGIEMFTDIGVVVFSRLVALGQRALVERSVKFGIVTLGKLKLGMVRLGKVKLGIVKPGLVVLVRLAAWLVLLPNGALVEVAFPALPRLVVFVPPELVPAMAADESHGRLTVELAAADTETVVFAQKALSSVTNVVALITNTTELASGETCDTA